MATGSRRQPGQHAAKLVEEWDGRRWRDVPDPLSGLLANITCGSPGFCLADRRGALAEWNGRTWRVFTAPSGPGAVRVSCGSPTMCAAVTGDTGTGPGKIDQWNGKTWHINPSASVCDGAIPGTPCAYRGTIDCGGRTNCMAPWYDCISTACSEGLQYDYEQWNGSTWQDQGNSPYNLAPQPSCSWGTFCMVTDAGTQNYAHASIWTSRTGWRDASPNLAAICHGAANCNLNGTLSCGAPENCVFVPADSPVSLIWTGMWRTAPLARINGTIPHWSALSCGSGTNCMAVGSTGQRTAPVAEHWNGTTWQITKPATS